MELQIEQVEYHRNGIGGESFFAVLFRDADEGGTRKLAISFRDDPKDEYGWSAPRVAVIDLERIAEHGVTFGPNSWRGDRYAGEIRKAIAAKYPEES